ncbi:unnamed protein product [Miscanthus lutarioriparius]|uniref:Fungal lipase-type domain-containing protein n=1 Tax=Miscanthus lutarioriparius TaxID=422564 RepID=A0A811MM23_9POAL|nr:unnamed protein product [Miscanthus lutarioriparius]
MPRFHAARAPWPSPAPPSARSPSPADSHLSLSGADDSASWPVASPTSFEPVPHACRAALAAYDDEQPGTPSSSPLCPPYRLLHDRTRGEVVLAVRGLGLARLEDYRLLLDAGGPEPFAGGHAHRGLLRAAVWLLNREGPALRRAVAEAGCRRLVFVGHSLGAGVAALAAVVADDFLTRTPAPLQHIFGSIFCLPCLLCFICMRDTFVSEGKLTDPAKLYAPGTVFHIVERKNCRCGRFPPEVRTAAPTESRFEHVVLPCNAAADHGIIWIEQEAQKALYLMEQEELTSPPAQQKMLKAQEAHSLNVEEGTVGLHDIEHLMSLDEEGT